jgi:protein gp37
MSEKTGIEWTDATWNPVRGCSRVSPGCQNCYAERVAARFGGLHRGDGEIDLHNGPFMGFAEMTPQGPRWTGKVALIEERLVEPLSWRKPKRIFVNSMSDLFHESLPDEAIDRVFAVMALAPQHTFQILTKRAARMRAYFTPDRQERVRAAAGNLAANGDETADYAWGRGWPLPNVWLGVSAEDQERADERIPLLLDTPAAVRFVSAEPLLGPVDLGLYLSRDAMFPMPGFKDCLPGLKWVIVGGESGPGARACDQAWIRLIVRKCRIAGVPCFVKQLGALLGGYPDGFIVDRWVGKGWKSVPPAFRADHDPARSHRPTDAIGFQLSDRKGGDPAEWPEDLRVREFPR